MELICRKLDDLHLLEIPGMVSVYSSGSRQHEGLCCVQLHCRETPSRLQALKGSAWDILNIRVTFSLGNPIAKKKKDWPKMALARLWLIQISYF